MKAGEELLIRDEGRVIARLVPEVGVAEEEERALRRMVAEGLIEAPRVGLHKELLTAVPIRGKPISETVLEDRR